jgi:hypothetical protein
MSINSNQLLVPFTAADKAVLQTVMPNAEPNPTIASQAVALAGVDNMQMMTALRVNQAILNIVGQGGTGEKNTGANLGAGVGVFANKTGITLNFKSLVAGTGITITDNGTFITFNVSAGGLTSTDQLPEGVSNLYYTDARVAANSAVVANTAKVSASGTVNTHSDVHYIAPSNGQVLTWDSVHSYWTNENSSGGGTGSAITGTFTNGTGSSIAALTLVSQDSSGNLAVTDISNETKVQGILGVTPASISNSASGSVILSGLIPNVTSGFNPGDVIFLNNLGQLTTTTPDISHSHYVAGDFAVKVGKITVNASNPSNQDFFVEIEVVGQL